MFIIVLNQNNIVSNGKNSTLLYKFPNSVVLKDKYIAVSSISLYYSWFNITSTNQNNSISIVWYSGSTPTTYTMVIPDGLYEIADLNNYFQFFCIQNGLYLVNASGDYVYYFEIEVNTNRYAIQLNTFQVPTALPSGWSVPSNWVGFPDDTFNPSITFGNYFNEIVGYTQVNGVNFTSDENLNNSYTPPSPTVDNYYVEKDGYGTLSYLSNSFPNVQPNSSLYVSISNINNPYALPSSIIYTIVPTVAIGEIISERPPNFMWNKLIDGTYNEIRLQLLGEDFQPITLKDPQMTFLLTFRDKDEGFLGTK